jgi:hypothetical protein
MPIASPPRAVRPTETNSRRVNDVSDTRTSYLAGRRWRCSKEVSFLADAAD